MTNETNFDALELARRANAEIDDVLRSAQEQSQAEQVPTPDPSLAVAAVLRAFRDLAKGG